MDEPILRDSIERLGSFSFSRSSGPGGQNVNKVNTKVELRIPVLQLEGLSDLEKTRVIQRLKNKINEDLTLIVSSDSERSQLSNRIDALQKAISLIINATHLPKPRKKTRPGKAAIERRLQSKKKASLKKANRKPQIDS